MVRTKSEWQKDDCLFCPRQATHEAVCTEGRFSANIRCCDSNECQEKAKKLAEDSVAEYDH